jgi:hypothetical protein
MTPRYEPISKILPPKKAIAVEALIYVVPASSGFNIGIHTRKPTPHQHACQLYMCGSPLTTQTIDPKTNEMATQKLISILKPGFN